MVSSLPSGAGRRHRETAPRGGKRMPPGPGGGRHTVVTDVRTGRLVLHPLTVAEAERVAAAEPTTADRWAADYPTDGDRKDARDLLELCATAGDPAPFGGYEIRLRDDGTAIGGLCFHRPPDEHGAVTVGYGVVGSARGHGYATEALRALLAVARSAGARTVRGDADHDNVASQRVMHGAGMRHVRSDEKVRYYEITFPRQ